MANGTVLLDSATVASTGTTDPNPNNNTSNTVSTTVVASADLSVTNTLAGPKPTAQSQTFTLVVTNNGPSFAANVVLTNFLPVGTTLVSQVQNSGPSFTYSQTTTEGVVTLLYKIPSLAPGASATFTIVATLAQPEPNNSELSDLAQITSATSDPNPQNNEADAKALLSNNADVAVSLAATSAPNPLTPGGKEKYTLTVVNNGPNVAQNVTFNDVFGAPASRGT